MALRILSGGTIAALAGAAMLAASSDPSPAFTLNSPSLEAPVAAAGDRAVYWRHWGWHGGWHHGWGWHRGWGWHGGWHRWGWGPYGYRPWGWRGYYGAGTASAGAGSAAGATVIAPGGDRLQACIFARSVSEISKLAVTF